jgi:pyruvate/2-oxoglutarate dehydrogenase complex dihydrolipoamide dehydrogenase (E3) component
MIDDILVIGGGPAGVTAALRARELGVSVTLVERGRLGGTCTNDGCVPTRVLAKASRLLRDTEQFADYGITIEKPELSFESLMTRVQNTVYKIHEKKQLINHLETSGVKVITGAGNAHFVDAHSIELADGRILQAEKIILCAGGRARRLDFPGAELALTHSDLWSLKTLPRRVAIAGAAATGCQVASILASFGSQVTLLEVAPRILRVEDEAISTVIQDAFTRRGVGIETGISGIDRIEESQQGLLVFYKKHDTLHQLEVDAVILSTGWLGNLDPLNLSAAGVQTDGRYIIVDDTLRTSVKHIFAAGDITGRMMLVQSAGYEALLAVENAVLNGNRGEKHTVVPHGGFTDPEYGSVGLTEEQARQQGEFLVATVAYSKLDRAVVDDHQEGLCKLIVSRDTHRILGAHVVGEQALEVIHLVAGGMAANIWIEQLAELEIAYPTFTAIVGIAARRIVNALGVRPLAPEWRTLKKVPAAEWERSD